MSALLVTLNGVPVVEYDMNQRLPGRQREFLERMDADMDAGLVLDGRNVASPDSLQRARFVAMQLLQAAQARHRGLLRATCAWLASRQPGLREIRAFDDGAQIRLELLFRDAE